VSHVWIGGGWGEGQKGKDISHAEKYEIMKEKNVRKWVYHGSAKH